MFENEQISNVSSYRAKSLFFFFLKIYIIFYAYLYYMRFSGD